MNYLMPLRDVLPMHCSANVGAAADSAIFFGLSGTGKTTLSADSKRPLVGDDEHGWSHEGIFNFEGGCYAKVIRLSPKAEPEIWAASHRFGTVLENVVLDGTTRALDLESEAKTENTRSAYPVEFIPNVVPGLVAGHPKTIIMLTADAFGVLPPISRLTAEQAMYHFLSGYTAKVAGTEQGVTEPTATFSTCFGAPFMVQHPTVYAKLLGERIATHEVTCWLVNTGWTGGAYGVGKRMSIAHTRAMVNCALDGSLRDATFEAEPFFGLALPRRSRAFPQTCSIRETPGRMGPRTTRKRRSSRGSSTRISNSSPSTRAAACGRSPSIPRRAHDLSGVAHHFDDEPLRTLPVEFAVMDAFPGAEVERTARNR
jgi:phosphoenolpyruvate carboxykinase (ATP)